ncbi:hypothetical protein KAR91_51985 [Candidatus Pacearchaeota archaeon]|nr:hypothetical protein [Candidatus Pacearchaeota archaeon]
MSLVTRGLGSTAMITQGYGAMLLWLRDVIVETVGGAGGGAKVKEILDWLTREEEDEFMVIVKIFLTLEALKNNGEELL